MFTGDKKDPPYILNIHDKLWLGHVGLRINLKLNKPCGFSSQYGPQMVPKISLEQTFHGAFGNYQRQCKILVVSYPS
jgi:hypothetical protein